MSRYTSDSRDRVLEAVDMVALISARTDLRRAGADSYFGRCPFHDERTGSFHVRPNEKHYYCFGCQASGDPFTFVMETEGLDFKGALEALADRFGVALATEEEDPAAALQRQRRERLYALLDRAASYYARYLWEAREAAGARDYLSGRGLSAETLRAFRVGYAPSAWDRILRASRNAGFSEEELLDAGLVQRSRARSGQVYDRFRERIMFPSLDARGRVRGFGARAMRENQRPKYLNTSDGVVYHKGSQLFGINLARSAAAKAGRMVLVEGYTDVLALHQAGIANAVGIMGTALTEEQVSELSRIVGVLELCLDADSAGQEAMVRAARVAAGRRLELRVVVLPDGQDPAELLAAPDGLEGLRAAVEGSVPFVVFRVEQILRRCDTSSAEGRDRALGELRDVLAELPASVLREELLRRIAGVLELSEGQLARLMSDGGALPRPPVGSGGGTGDAGLPGSHPSPRAGGGNRAELKAPDFGLDQALRAERTFLTLCLALPEAGEQTLASIDIDQLLTGQLHRRAARHLAGRAAVPLTGLPPGDPELERVVADLVARAARVGEVGEERLRHARLVLELARLDRALVRARATGQPGIDALAREREQVRADIHGVVAQLERAV